MDYFGDYRLLKPFGCGGFGTVFLALNSATGELVAVKIINEKLIQKYGKSVLELFKNEVSIQNKLDHERILKIKDYYPRFESIEEVIPQPHYLVTEYASSGHLFDVIYLTGSFSETFARYYFLQLIEAVNYLNSKGISHLDIKLENVLLNSNYDIKLSDFGLSSE